MTTIQDDRIGRYTILAELGRGAMGVVYKARDPELDRLVAIKTLHAPGGRHGEPAAELRTRLSQEATAAARLSHPNIVAVYDVITAGEVPCIVMEYVEGQTLAELIAAGPLPVGRAVQVALQVCEALDYAHCLGVVHRDVKPGNILVTEQWTAKLSDFSIARLKGANATQTGVLVGTPAYLAPEQVQGRGADARGDLFSLGVVLYEAVTGVSPFQADDVATVLYHVVDLDPPTPRRRNPEVSPWLDTAIRRAMSKEPDDRYANARAFAQALADATDPAETAVSAAWPARLRGMGLRAALIAGLCLVVAGSAGGGSGVRWDTGVGSSPITHPGAAPEPTIAGPGSSLPPGEADAATNERAMTANRKSVEQKVQSPVSTRSVARSSDRAADDPGRTSSGKATAATGSAAVEPTGCLSVNATPFASVYVDGQPIGETPRACLRVRLGERRIQFQAADDRSPERVVLVTERHTADEPFTISYDFRSHQFREP